MPNLNMFCICIHDEIYQKIKSLNYIPVGLGDNIHNPGWLRVNTLDNIAQKNKFYGEYTFHYWFWKNQLMKKKNQDWTGFCAYRRFWLKKNSKPYEINNLSNDILKEVPNEWEKYETIIGNKFDLTGLKLMKLLKYGKISFLRNPKALFKSGRSIRFQFDMFHGNGVLDKAIDVLEDKERDDFRNFVIEKNSYNQGNMFICKSQNIMNEYYKTIFGWLKKLEDIYGFNNDSYSSTRIYAFLAERFLPYWFNKYTKCLEWPIAFHDTTN